MGAGVGICRDSRYSPGRRSTLDSVLERINGAQLASTANPVNGIATNTVANASLRVPYLGFSPGGLQEDETIDDSKYNSLQATVRKQMSHGLQLQAAYTYGRAFTTTSYYFLNILNQPLRYGLNPAYRPQRFTINYSWDLPLGKHDGLVGKLLMAGMCQV